MNKYIVIWSKTYRYSGEEIVEANSLLEAEEEVEEKLGDYTGSLKSNETSVEATELKC